MKINKRLSSYPILISGDDDYVDSYFDVTLMQSVAFDKLTIEVGFLLNNDGLKKLISEEKAAYAVHFECPLLFYRDCLITKKEELNHMIDLNDIANTIEVSTYIVATQDIPKYYNEKFNWEYGNDGIDITKGNMLAIGPTYTISIDRAKDGLKKLSDIICIKQYETGERSEMSVSVEGDIIMIFVNKTIKDQYFIHGRQYLYNIISMIMVPAMTYVLTCMKNNEENLRGYKWFDVIEQLLIQNGVEVAQLSSETSTGSYSIYELAQKIFKTPIEKGMLELNQVRGE